jgi:hypothetical protein
MNHLLIVLAWLAVSIQPSLAGEENVKGNGNVVKKERSPGAFESLSTGGSIDIRIIQDGTEKVVVETDENIQDAVVTETDGGSLSVHIKKGMSVSPTKLVVHVHCKTLTAISSGGSGDIYSDTPLRGDHLAISHGGSGNYTLELDVKRLKISTAGSGDYMLKGKAGSMNLSMAGSGDVDARNLDCMEAKVSAAGSGDVHLKKGTDAKVSSVGSGDVSYH